MKINTLRRLDIWIGRPICWLLTILYKIKHLFIRKTHKKGLQKNAGKILFIKLFGIGSIVLAIPSIAAVKKKYPESQIFFLTFKGNEPVLTLTDTILPQNIYTIRRDKFFNLVSDITRCLFSLIRDRITVVLDFEFFSRFSAILSFFIRSKYRIGFYGFHTEGLKRGSFINFPINYNHTLHTSRAFFTLLKPLGIFQKDYDSILPRLQPSKHFENKIKNIICKANNFCEPDNIKQWVIINPNTSDLIELRKWPGEHFVKLTDRLLDTFNDLGVVFIGSKGEGPYVDSLCRKLNFEGSGKRVVNLAGLTTISDLLDLFHFSNLLIANDSGPAHLTALTNIHSIVLFGPETPDLYSPLGDRSECLYLGLDCQPCVTIYNGKYSYCKENICLHQIEPEFIFNLALENIENHQ